MAIKGEHGKRIDRLISQSYDSDPKVRMNAVSELSTMAEHPGAVFALLELASDKDDGVKGAAQEALSKVKQRDEVGSIKMLFQQSETEKIETQTQVRERLMPSIDRLFTNKTTKKRLMSSLEKFFSERKKHHEARAENAIQEGAGQTVLKDHLEVISQVESIGEFASRKKPSGQKPEESSEKMPKQEEREIGEEADSISIPQMASGPKMPQGRDSAGQGSRPREGLAGPAIPQVPVHEENVEVISREVPDGIPEPKPSGAFEEAFSRAYLLATKKEVSDKMLSDEERRMVAELTEAVKTAFKAARAKARGMQVAHLASLQAGMKKIRTGELTVGEAQEVEVLKGKRRAKAIRIVLLDQTGRFPLYLTEARGKGICVGDKLSLEGAYVDEVGEGTETALALPPRGKIMLLK